MKKIIIFLICIIIVLGLSACGDANYGFTSEYVEQNQFDDVDNNTNWTEDSIYANNDSYVSQNTTSGNDNNNVNYTTSNNYSASEKGHTHYYSSVVTKEATCAAEGIKTYKCSCGDTYTETISKTTYHDWEYATCTKPDTCKVCGITRGTEEGHSYYSNGKCSRCGQMDPLVNETLSKCTLTLPSFPKIISYKSSSGKFYSQVSVTAITYKFEYEGDGTVSLIAKFFGQKLYDYRGSNQSDDCKIGWKLYDANNNVVRAGTFSSPNIAVGETFADKEEDLIYNFDKGAPGAYRLEILDVN